MIPLAIAEVVIPAAPKLPARSRQAAGSLLSCPKQSPRRIRGSLPVIPGGCDRGKPERKSFHGGSAMRGQRRPIEAGEKTLPGGLLIYFSDDFPPRIPDDDGQRRLSRSEVIKDSRIVQL
jgi:hypothetical protein